MTGVDGLLSMTGVDGLLSTGVDGLFFDGCRWTIIHFFLDGCRWTIIHFFLTGVDGLFSTFLPCSQL